MIDCRSIARLIAALAWAFAAMPLCASEPASKPAAVNRGTVTQDPVTQDPAARLLELGGRYSPAALAKAREYYGQLPAKPKADARVQYAFALVLIRQHCEKEALELLGQLVAREPDALHLWRAKIWAELAVHKDREALTDMRPVADALAKQSPATLPAADAESWRETAELLGRIFGFLEIPRTNSLPDDEVRSAKQYLLSRLGDERTEFEESEQVVADRFAKARAALEEMRAKRLAASKTRQDEVEQQKRLVDETEVKIDHDAERLKTDTKAEVDRLDQIARMVNKNIMACQLRLNAVRQSINLHLPKLSMPAQVMASNVASPSPITNQKLFFDKNMLAQLSAEQTLLIQQISQLNEQLRTTLDQRDALLDQGERTNEDLRTQTVALRREEKRLERTQQAEAKKIAAQREKTQLTGQTPFTSFEPFPFDSEKQRLLGSHDP